MPEGDTVWLAGKRMHDALAGRVLTVSDFRVPQLATADLTGRTVTEVVSRGKHLLTRISAGDGSTTGDELTLHTHFRMDGSWHLYRHGDRWHGGPEWQVRVLLENPEWQAVGYRLPVVELLARDRESDAVGHLGPDLLGPDWDLPEAVRRISADPDREIGQALLDQRNLAGIGNLYKTEVCFLTGLSPWTPVRDLTPESLIAVVERAHRLLEANKGGYVQVTTGDPRRGQWHWVFERTGKPCRRCRTPVATAEQGAAPYARLAYWCPRCQPGPAPSPTRPPRRDRTVGRTRYRP